MTMKQFVREYGAYLFWSILPTVSGSAATILGIIAAMGVGDSVAVRAWAIVAALLTCALLVVKAVRDKKREAAEKQARYDAIDELRNRIAPASELISKLALVDSGDTGRRQVMLRHVADMCASALVSMMPGTKDARAVVYEVDALRGTIAPIGTFGRSGTPRSFAFTSADGAEILEFLSTEAVGDDGLFEDLEVRAPSSYNGDLRRYRTMLRARIGVGDLTFGMITVDAPKPKSLSQGELDLTRLIAAEVATAFAIAAG